MSTACVAVRDLARIESLPESSPERAHVGQCPRCRSLMLAYREFADPGAWPEGARMVEADWRLFCTLVMTPTTRAVCCFQGVPPTRKLVFRSWLVVPALLDAMQTTVPMESAAAV